MQAACVFPAVTWLCDIAPADLYVPSQDNMLLVICNPLGSLVYHLASHQIVAERCVLLFSCDLRQSDARV